MGNVSGRHVTPYTFCKSRAFRAGWEDYRLHRPARFDDWGTWGIAYEKGRQSAALAASNDQLIPVPDKSKIQPEQVMLLKHWSMRLLREARC